MGSSGGGEQAGNGQSTNQCHFHIDLHRAYCACMKINLGCSESLQLSWDY
jgi:hypothetical protein